MTAAAKHFVGALALACIITSCALRPSATADHFRIILAGDSTMASVTGYGDALCQRFDAAVTCINLARGGRSTKSFRAEGLWEALLARLRESDAAPTFVLIQFGHNDQPGKPGRSTSLPEFTENMRRYVDDVRAAGATPVLVTPLTRRSFKDSRLIDGLAPWAQATIEVAHQSKTILLDLHADSIRAVAALGPEHALDLAELPPPESAQAAAKTGTTVEAPRPPPSATGGHVPAFDYTHLGHRGATLFSEIVATEIRASVPPLAPHIR